MSWYICVNSCHCDINFDQQEAITGTRDGRGGAAAGARTGVAGAMRGDGTYHFASSPLTFCLFPPSLTHGAGLSDPYNLVRVHGQNDQKIK